MIAVLALILACAGIALALVALRWMSQVTDAFTDLFNAGHRTADEIDSTPPDDGSPRERTVVSEGVDYSGYDDPLGCLIGDHRFLRHTTREGDVCACTWSDHDVPWSYHVSKIVRESGALEPGMNYVPFDPLAVFDDIAESTKGAREKHRRYIGRADDGTATYITDARGNQVRDYGAEQ